MIRKKKWFPILYMFVITAVLSFIVIGFSEFTSERVETNQKLEFEKAVLAVLPGLYDENEKISGMKLHARFQEKVDKPDEKSAGAYTLQKDGRIVAYALPIAGRGFWAPIKAVIGLQADKRTVTGIAFYQQNETPGLGAEIAKPEFRAQFKGKIIRMDGKPLSLKRPGSTLDESSVNAVTGATQTSVRLEKIIDDALVNWRREMEKESN